MDSYNDSMAQDNEFILLYKGKFSKNVEFPHELDDQLELDTMDDTECKAEFCYRKTEIALLVELLNIPEKFVCHQSTTALEKVCGWV